MIQAAIGLATERQRVLMTGIHLLYALLQPEHGPAAELLALWIECGNFER